jgi:hypothetical protein
MAYSKERERIDGNATFFYGWGYSVSVDIPHNDDDNYVCSNNGNPLPYRARRLWVNDGPRF